MSAVIELEDKKTEVSSNGNDVGAIKPYLFTVEIYDEMIRKGILTENDNVELLNGRIIKKMPKGTNHSLYNDEIARFFYKNIDDDCVIRNQNPIWLSEVSEPEPDIILAKLPRDKYLENHPKPEDILLIIEISDSTLNLDKNAKSRMYASAEIVQYLVVDVVNKAVIDYREPFEDEYQSKQTYKIGDKFSLVEFPKIKIAVEDFFKS
jgi:Uma2 family endonuclease